MPPSVSDQLSTSVNVNRTIFLSVKFLLRIDDALDLAAEHAMGGIVGLMLSAFFTDRDLVALDGISEVDGGWLNHNWKQLYKQFAYVCATVGYTFVVTAFLAKIFDLIPLLRLRASPEEEALGMDDTQVRQRFHYAEYC